MDSNCEIAMNERIRQKRKQVRNRIFILLGTMLTVSLIFAACFWVKSGRPEALFEALLGEKGRSLQEGAGFQAAMTAKVQKAKAKAAARAEEEERALKEISREVAPSLRIENTVDFTALKEQNRDVYAWIFIPGTKVDYPVLQHPVQDEYYLNHTIDHVSGLPGSIYSEPIHPKDFSAHQTILYGHNMKNDTMFGSLHDYENSAFFEEQPYVYIHLPDRTLLYQIFAAVQFSDAYLPGFYDFEEEEAFVSFIEDLRNSPGLIRENMEVPFGSRLLTLSTCIGDAPKNRFLVVALLAGEYEKGS